MNDIEAAGPIEYAARNGNSNSSSIRNELNQYDDLNSEMLEMIKLLGDKLTSVLNREEAPTDPEKPNAAGYSDIGDWLARANVQYRQRINTLRYIMGRIDL
jgi:hypothetical protein